MRSEKEMLDLILRVAKEDNRIRAVYMNGSRTNSHVPKDIFQDYDVVYVVEETASFIEENTWINVFGELLMIQEPDRNDQFIGREVDLSQSYGYLMLFTDGNRIDLRIQTLGEMIKDYGSDSLTVPLLDKDGVLPIIPQASDEGYHVRRPSIKQYLSNCNNFWWCLQNVAKGIWRDELPYSKQMFELVIRSELHQMVDWWIGSQHNFKISPGKFGKYYKKHLPKRFWEMYKKTYCDSEYDHMWESLFTACELFRILAVDVGEELGVEYPYIEDKNMMMYLEGVRNLPKDATDIY
ncbi:aminoglycoside 6-adenylyltransferase [Robertmurraya sp. FSL R5-0851]|uniref:aminoglycoside 6-adenylyltransferase n=1 Tax=Robertmurraya sp. FSL R5-0851 TaxID=2921584 RepID=UPI0013721A16